MSAVRSFFVKLKWKKETYHLSENTMFSETVLAPLLVEPVDRVGRLAI